MSVFDLRHDDDTILIITVRLRTGHVLSGFPSSNHMNVMILFHNTVDMKRQLSLEIIHFMKPLLLVVADALLRVIILHCEMS